jgi:hypothetical protein
VDEWRRQAALAEISSAEKSSSIHFYPVVCHFLSKEVWFSDHSEAKMFAMIPAALGVLSPTCNLWRK